MTFEFARWATVLIATTVGLTSDGDLMEASGLIECAAITPDDIKAFIIQIEQDIEEEARSTRD